MAGAVGWQPDSKSARDNAERCTQALERSVVVGDRFHQRRWFQNWRHDLSEGSSDVKGQTRTLSISIYDSVQALDYSAAAQTSLILVIFAFLVLLITYGLQRRVLPP